MHTFRFLLFRHPLALVLLLVSTFMVGTPCQVKAAQVIPQNQLSVVSSDSQQNETYAASKSIDGNSKTMWHTRWSPTISPLPHQITLQLSAPYIISGFRYLPRQDGWLYGIVTTYAIYVSNDGTTWGLPVTQGIWPGTATLKEVTFTGVQGRYVRLVATASASGPYTSAAEINVLGTPVSTSTTPTSVSRKLSWIDNATNEDGYKIERKVGTSGTYVRLAVVQANTSSYTDANTLADTTYCYRVQAFNTLGDSPFSNDACSTGQTATSAPLLPPDMGGNTRAIASTDNTNDPSAPHGKNTGTHTSHALAVRIGVFRPNTSSWYLDRNANGQFDGCATDSCSSSFGLAGDLPIVGDWNGTGMSQLGVFNPNSRLWDLDANGNTRWDGCEDDLCRGPFGKVSDLPVSGYWLEKRSSTRIGIFRPQTGEWILDTNGNGRVDQRGTRDTRLGPFGTATDLPVVGDWTGSGKTQIGTFDPSTGQWRLDQNGNGVFDGCNVDRCAGPFGKADGYPIVADWLGSGVSQIGIFDAATGMWQLDTNGNGVFDGCTTDQCVGPFGQAGDIPIVGQW